ncbi:MAG: hypothetical protein OJJ54_16915 [Pseudonocardia sp.]|nr:hypothetical protein [Pseudonocardia sp.]
MSMNRSAPPADPDGRPDVPSDHESPLVSDAADHLYGMPPEEFVPTRDELVAAAREAGDKEAARAIGHLRRPTQAAWLANLLARERAEQLDGVLALADELAGAQRSLDGPALRALSAQRQKLVGAMAREARRLAASDGHRVTESVERDLRGILEAALADPGIADEVRSGRLTRTVSYSGFGPDLGPVDRARPSGARGGTRRPAPRPSSEPDAGTGGGEGAAEREQDRRRRERREQEERARRRAEAEEALAAARRAADEAADRNGADRIALDDAEAARGDAERRVDELAAELDRARDARADASAAVKDATRSERESARAARDAVAALERAEAHLAELQDRPPPR